MVVWCHRHLSAILLIRYVNTSGCSCRSLQVLFAVRDKLLPGHLLVQGLIRLLSTCASGSAAAAESLLLLRISSILKDVLAGSGLISSTSVSPSSVNRPPEQVCAVQFVS